MNVTVEVVGEGSHDLEVENATYADLLAAVDLSPHEASVMVDGRPVPEDQPVEADHVTVLRLIKGGVDFGQEAEAGPLPEFDRECRPLGVSKLDFELPNAGTGPDPLSLADLAAGPTSAVGRPTARRETSPRNDAVVLLFHRDYHCRNCREQARAVADRYGEFRDHHAAVVSVLPEPTETAEKWQRKLHLPFPLLADPDNRVADQYGQPTRFGRLGQRFDLVGRLPEVAILDVREKPRLYAVHRGDSSGDRPEVDDVLAMIDRLLADKDRAVVDER
jgi:peroxiredoxin Q/BCP